MTSLTIVIPVKNDARRLARCLGALAVSRPDRAQVKIVVADNGSSDESASVASAAGAGVLVRPDLRVPALRNTAASETDSDLLAFVDADHEVAPGWVDAALAALEPADVGAAGALYTPPVDGTWVQRTYGALRGETRGRHDVAWLGSGNMVVRRTAFEQIGGFDASLEACEDVDLCRRLRAAGWKIVGDERLRSVHHGDPSTLGALFQAERWRGRDNLRVSLRGPLAWRDVPSVATPLVILAAIIAVILSPAGRAVGLAPLWIAGAASIALLGLPVLKALRIVSRSRMVDPVFLIQAYAVALTYDLARAMALVTRARHHRR